jgi:hypothetical protein
MAGYNENNIVDLNSTILDNHLHKNILDLSYDFDAFTIEAERGDFDVHIPLGWTRNQSAIEIDTYNNLPVFIIPDNDSNIYTIQKTITFQDIQNLHLYGGVFGGTIALDINDGGGMFSSIETQQATSILNTDGITYPFATNINRRINAGFNHDGNFVSSNNVEGTSEVIFNGINTVNVINWNGDTITNIVPKILPGEFFKYEFHIQNGLDNIMYLYVDGVLVDNPTFDTNNGGKGGERLQFSSGSTADSNRISYIRTFGATVNTSESTINVSKIDLEDSSGVKLVIPNGTMNYSIILGKDLNLPLGYTYSIVSQNIGTISWSSNPAEIGLSGTIDGFATGETELSETTEIIKTNILKDGARFISKTIDTSTEFESLRTGMITYSGISLHASPLTIVIGDRSMRFVDKENSYSKIITKPSVDFEFIDGLNALDDLGVVHFYEDIDGNIFGSAKTDWSTPAQRRRYVYLGNTDVNLAKDGFVQANNPLVSAFGLLDSFGDYLAIGGSIKGRGGKVSPNATEPLGLDITGYTAVAWGRNFGNQEIPHTPTSSDIVGADLHLGYKTSDISMLFGDAVSSIDPANYQKIEDITLSVVPAGKYTIQRVYQFPGTTYNMVVYGSTLYDNLEQAILHTSTERYNLHPSLTPACFLAYIIVRQDVVNLETAIADNQATILNYDGRMHPSTIGAETSPSNALQAGGELRSMVDQFANSEVDPILFIDFEIGEGSLYGSEWDAVNKTLKNVSQKDMVVNIVPQVGRRDTGTSVGLEIFIDSSFDNGNTWHVDDADTYTTYQSIAGQIDSLTASVLIFRVIPNAMIRVGMMLTSAQDEVGIVSHGLGDINPGVSTSGRYLPSCILTIT